MITSTKQSGFTLIELMIAIAIAAILSTLAAPSLAGLLKHNKVKSAAILFQDNLRQARYESKTRSNSRVVFCAIQAGNTQKCVDSHSRVAFSNGWQWFVDEPDNNGNYNSILDAGEELLGNTFNVKTDKITVKIRTVPFQRRIAKNRIIFRKGKPAILAPTSHVITPIVTFAEVTDIREALWKSTVSFDKTGRSTLRH